MTTKKQNNTCDRETAVIDVNKWLDTRRISERKRESKELKDAIETLIENFQEGNLTLLGEEGKYNIVQKMIFPEFVNGIKELSFKPRLTVSEIEQCRAVSKGNETHIRRAVALLCGVSPDEIKTMEASDWALSSTIYNFFFVI